VKQTSNLDHRERVITLAVAFFLVFATLAAATLLANWFPLRSA